MQIKKRLTLLILMVTCVLSVTTFFLVLNYLDPYSHTIIAVSMLLLSFILALSSGASLMLYFIKRIYFRGDVYLFHVINSFRQGFFASLFILGIVVFKIIGAPLLITGLALLMLFCFLEMFIQDLSQ